MLIIVIYGNEMNDIFVINCTCYDSEHEVHVNDNWVDIEIDLIPI